MDDLNEPKLRDSLLQSAADYRSATPEVASKWLSILQSVTEGAMSHLDLHDMLRELLGRIREAMEADNAAILLMEEDGQHLTVYAAHGPEEQGIGKARVRVGHGVAGTIAASGKPLIVDELSQIEVENPLLQAVGNSLVGAPLVAGGRVIGVVHVDSTRPRGFTDEDARLLQVLACHIALAIEHAQLYESERAAREQAEAAMRQLRALQLVSDVALASVRLRDLLHVLLERIRQIMEVDNVAILLPDADGRELTLYSVHGLEEAVLGQVHVPVGEGVAGRIAATREPYVVENLAAVPVSNPFLREHFRSLLGVPLLTEGRLVGVLHVDTMLPRHFTEDDRQLLEVLAERIAVAIDRARVFESVEEHRAAAETRAAALEETTRRMDEFLNIASHELRTPLTSLKVNVQVLDYWLSGQHGRRAEETPADYLARVMSVARPLVQRSNSSITRLDRLIGDLLDASRIHENRLELRREQIDLVAVARDVVEEQRQAHHKRTLRLEGAESAPLLVVADADRIGQVVTNYISNALKFSKSETPITIQVEREGEQARVAVSDQGIGIPDSEQEAIWNRFYRVAGVEHQSGSQVGLGLGLYISRDIIARHGGRVGVRSAPGEGSTFWFTLPLERPA